MTKPIEIELSKNGENLYIFFGGIAAEIAMPPFEFYNSSKILDENKIFIRDFSQCWYQNGLPGISEDIRSTAMHIESLIEEVKPQKIFLVGNSMGGYAAILFSSLIRQGEAIAFAPQTFISPILRFIHNDFRWKKQIFGTYRKSIFKNKIWNLKPLLLRSKPKQKITIFVSEDNKLDCIHALRLKNVPNVNVCQIKGGGHGVVKVLRDKGELAAIMSGTYI